MERSISANFWLFSDLVNKGELDILLTKPIHPLFLALSRWMNITNIFNLGLGLAKAFETVTEVVEHALRLGLTAAATGRRGRARLPSYDMGPYLMSPAERDTLGQAEEEAGP